jgi:hypothetical protein
MASITDIANLALMKMGVARITDISENTPNARTISAAYPNILKQVLVDGPELGWTFARQRVEIDVSSTEPIFGYDYQYDLPADCLKITSVTSGETAVTDWIREGSKLLTNEVSDTIELTYIKNVTDYGSMPPYFVDLFALALAKSLCFVIKGDVKREADLVQQFELLMRNRAKGLDMREQYYEDSNTDWVDAGR